MHLLEWARRHARDGPGSNALARLLAGDDEAEVARATGLPPAAVSGIRSFYDLLTPGPRVCDGTACHFAGAADLAARLARDGAIARVRCLGHCHNAPAFLSGHQVLATADGSAA